MNTKITDAYIDYLIANSIPLRIAIAGVRLSGRIVAADDEAYFLMQNGVIQYVKREEGLTIDPEVPFGLDEFMGDI